MMEHKDLKRLFANFHCNRPASSGALQQFDQASQFRAPRDYIHFLEQVNGGEGFVGPKEYLILWPVEELVRMNEEYEVEKYAPQLFLFGSNGGGEAYAFDNRSGSSVVAVPFIGMDISLAQPLAPTFQAFAERLYAQP